MDTIVKIGEKVPNFTLIDLNGQRHSLIDYRGRVVIINFWSAECPWSARTEEKMKDLLAELYEDVLLVTIAPNASEPLEMLKKVAAERNLTIVLPDHDQQVATLFEARTTPHVFLIDQIGVLRYQGAFDDASFRLRTPQKHYLQDALNAVMNDEEPTPSETVPYGCAIVRYAP